MKRFFFFSCLFVYFPFNENLFIYSFYLFILFSFTLFYLQFEEAMSVALPICVKRIPFGREAVIKMHQASGRWSELHTSDVVFEDNRVSYLWTSRAP